MPGIDELIADRRREAKAEDCEAEDEAQRRKVLGHQYDLNIGQMTHT